jgi:hypothetical protein
VRVTWPNGEEQNFAGVATNHVYTIFQGSGIRRADLPPGKAGPSSATTGGGSD